MHCKWCNAVFGILCFLFSTSIVAEYRSLSPKIVTSNGNLIFQSGKNKNISFEVDSTNDIIFGDTSIRELANVITSQAKEIEDLRKNLGNGCKSHLCSSHGVCVPTGHGQGYRCVCEPGYGGIHCKSVVRNIQGCNSTLKHQVGIISSPGFPFTYTADTQCTWTIIGSPMKNIEIFIIKMDIGTFSHCGESGYLQISDSNEVFKLCGVSSSRELLSGNNVTLLFKTGPGIPVGTGFSLLFNQREKRECERATVLRRPAGIIKSPRQEDRPLECVWVIHPEVNENLQLKLHLVDIVNHAGSCENYLEILAGSDDNAPTVRKICRSIRALTLTLPSKAAYIKFVSNGKDNQFDGVYDTVCGGTISLHGSGSYEIKSPLFPLPYPRKKKCVWNIKGEVESTLAVRFLEFDVEPHQNCLLDSLSLYDGQRGTSPLLARYCGNTTPLPVMTTDQNLMVEFETDGDGNFRGFKVVVDVVHPGCGGVFHGNNGSIHAPAEDYYGECLYTVSSDKAEHDIQLIFTEFTLAANCEDEYIQIFESQTADGDSRKYCGTVAPPRTLSERSITVKFYSNNMGNGTAFFARWKSVAKPSGCDVVVQRPAGSIQSPNYPKKYYPNMDCRYLIIVENGHKIKLTFDVFGLEHHTTCTNDFLSVYNGENANAPLVGTFCGTRGPETIVSFSNILSLHFKTDLSGQDKGFHATFTSGLDLCGGYLHQASGFIMSPNFPRQYSPNEYCVWWIQSNEGNFVNLVIDSFNLESKVPCALNDYVRIYDGEDRKSKLIAELCGQKEANTRFKSSSHHVMIEFKTNSMIQSGGFRFHYTSGCGEVYDARSGVITSPNYPLNYPLARTCTWIIKSNVGEVININSVDFNLQSSSSCRYDYLSIMDGENNLPKFCGSTGPSLSIASTSVTLTFQSDHRISYKGFKLNYNITGCSAYLLRPNGTFSTPNYPSNYPDKSYCMWRIKVEPGKRVFLDIPAISVGSGDCRNNKVIVYNGPNENYPVIGSFCNHPSRVMLRSSSNDMAVLFTSTRSDVGFTAGYATLDGGCGGLITSSSGSIQSPSYSSDHPQGAACTWNIKSPNVGSLKLTFQSFRLGSGSNNNCSKDYLQIWDGATSQIIGTFCGTSLPPPQASTSNTIKLVYRSDNNDTENTGFNVKYEMGCGGTILVDDLDSSGLISTPGFPSTYSESVCVWHLKAEIGYIVHLNFEAFSLEADNCTGDYVEIHNGDSNTAPLLRKHCGSTKPSAVTSSGNSLYVKFFANAMNNSFTGFKAHYSSIFVACGVSLKGYKGSIANTYYPEKTPAGFQYCRYDITVAVGNLILLNFEQMDLGGECDDTSITISEDGEDKMKLCRDGAPDFKSTTNAVHLHLSSTGDHETLFKINYRIVCSLVLGLTDTGTIQSPNYPNPYPHNSECFWRMTAPETGRVEIKFDTFQLEQRLLGGCNDYVDIYEGDTFSKIATYCGSHLPRTETSIGRSIFVKFVSDGSKSLGGFSMKYKFSVDASGGCGGEFIATGVPGYIASRNYPLQYPSNQRCTYRIITTPGASIKLTFLSFELESANSCIYDNVQIYYDDQKERRIARLCGTMGRNQIYHSIGSTFLLVFASDRSDQFTGFYAKYERVCGGLLTASKGIIHPPMYGENYTTSENCTWIVQQRRGVTIKMNFTHFDLESSTNCSKDYLIIRNGAFSDSPLIGRYCGSNIPADYVSTGNALFFQFVSDGSTTGAGFYVVYENYVHGCGGILSLTDPTLSYEITSPGYPDTYPNSVDCEWFLKVPVAFVVDFSFIQFTSNFSTCTDHVFLHSGPTKESSVMKDFCASNLPELNYHYKSSRNGMYVRLRADVKPAHVVSYFKASWKIGCGGWRNAESGTIESSFYPSAYPANSNCTYFIHIPGNKLVHLQFKTFNLLNYTLGCPDNGDYIEVFDSDHATKIGRYCGTSLPPSIVSSANALVVHFISNNGSGSTGNSSKGFQAHWTTVGQECGGELNEEGTFQTPFYPEHYPLHRQCKWILKSTPGISVRLTFETFNLESTVNCTGDRVVILNGRHENSPVLETYCGVSTPPVIQSSGDYLTVIFVSDYSADRGTGFKASFVSGNIACGDELSGESGTITSPGFPDGYKDDIECEWKITAEKPKVIKITIVDFQLEEKFYGVCWDYFIFKDSDEEKERICGGRENNGRTFTSHTSVVNILFHSDDSLNDAGFKIIWEAVEQSCIDKIIPIREGVIASPGYPLYGSNLDCTWKWMEQEGDKVTLQFIDFDLLGSTNCTTDSVTIQNGRLPDSPVIATWCGNKNDSAERVFHSFGPNMRLRFKTGNVVNRTANRGFRIRYSTASDECGGMLLANSGNITSPNYPNAYPDSSSCSWIILTEVGSEIFIYIEDLDIEDHHSCEYDALEIFDGVSPYATRIAHLCGRDHESNYHSSENAVYIRFRSDPLFGGRGFKIHYNTGCGGVFKGRTGSVKSPRYPLPYPPNQDCRWIIDLKPDYHVALTQMEYNLPPSNNTICDTDYAEVWNGLNTSASSAQRFCGDKQNQHYDSSNHQMSFRFVSDSSRNNTYKGIKAGYVAECGEIIVTSDPGVIKFPRYGEYAKNEECVWVIQFPEGERIALRTKSIDIESYRNFHCFFDYLEIRDGRNESAPLVGRFCGTERPPTFHTRSNYAYIKFLSDETLQEGGFEIQYSRESPECGGILTASSGNITSPGYPGPFSLNMDCGWKIIQPEGTIINITFTYFELSIWYNLYGNYRDCSNYIRIFDAPYPDVRFSRWSPLCRRLTGDSVESRTNSLYISFHSGNSRIRLHDGFVISYTTYKKECGGLVEIPAGQIRNLTSPGYPENITIGEKCKWVLKAPPGYQVLANIEEIAFPDYVAQNCPGAHIELIDGLVGKKTLLCGRYMEGMTILSTLRAASFVLVRTTSAKPFKVTLQAVKGCNKTITASGGLITSPNFPFTYTHSSKCHYFINAPVGQMITIFPYISNIEVHEDCQYDYLEINDGGNSSAPRFPLGNGKRYCGNNLPPTLRSSGNKMHILFSTDKLSAEEGFAFTYTISSHACGGNITGWVGSITSPNYPGLYNGQYNCEWDITVRPDATIMITMKTFELEPPTHGSDCTTVDYFEVSEGSTSYGKHCGLTRFTTPQSNSNKVKVKFVSNNVKNNYRGFQLTYSAIW